MTIFEQLISDHDKQRELCEKLSDTQSGSKERARLWEELRVELEAHAAAEEQALYASLMEKPQGTEPARHSVAEHQDMSNLIHELDAMDQGSKIWEKKFKTLAHDVIHHLDEEERDIFPQAKDVLPPEELDELGAVFKKRKSEEAMNYTS